jgi:hypothetical protein
MASYFYFLLSFIPDVVTIHKHIQTQTSMKHETLKNREFSLEAFLRNILFTAMYGYVL